MRATSAMISWRSRGAMPAVGSSSSSRRGALGQRDGQLQPALVAVGEDPARLGRLLAQPHALEERQRLVAVEAPRGHEEVEVAPVVAEEGRLHVLQRGEPAEDAGDLEGAPDPAPAEPVRRQPADLLAREVDLARVVRRGRR